MFASIEQKLEEFTLAILTVIYHSQGEDQSNVGLKKAFGRAQDTLDFVVGELSEE